MQTELLAPAGDMLSAVQAVRNGADAIYLGGKTFGARASAQNFSYDQMAEAIAFAHTFGVKVYVTVNTLVYEDETKAFLQHAGHVMETGADALIMQDIGMIAAVRSCFPDIAIHSSTQMHNHSDAALEFAKKQGAVRAVLAREMTLDQIRSLKCDIEKEVFIHGALCICYSGQCFFSALTKQRSGNRGLCAQSCRMRYRLSEEEIMTDEKHGGYLLSPKDLALFEDIGLLLDAGISCFKIEGRLKTPEYVGLVTKIYAGLLAQYRKKEPLKTNEADIDDLCRLFNRGFTKAHLLNVRGEALMSIDRPNHRGTRLGRVAYTNDQRIALKLCAPLCQGDGIKFEREDEGFICNKIYKDGRLVASAKAGETIELHAKARTSAGDTVVKTTDSLLIKRLQKLPERRIVVNGRLTAKKGELLRLDLWDEDGHSVSALGSAVQPSRTSAVSAESLRDSISKLGDTPYVLSACAADADKDVFIAKSAVNALRRDAVARLTALRTAVPHRRVCKISPPQTAHPCDMKEALLHVLVRNRQQLEAAESFATGDILTEDETLYSVQKTACPRLRLKTDRMADEPATYVGAHLLVTDTGGLYVYGRGNDLTVDSSVSALNAYTLGVLFQLGAKRITLSIELSTQQAAQMLKAYRDICGHMPAVEAIVFARRELMSMRHCIKHGALGSTACSACQKKLYHIEDKKGCRYPVLTDANCQSRIFESRPYKAPIAKLFALGIRHFRLELFDEDMEEASALIKHTRYQIEKLR